MKKIVLTLAGALAATAFAPQAAAVPSFARQTGMACSACHFQHFPVLNSFGRAFKASGYTMMGAQGKVEGEHLSIPDTLNASMLIKLRYQKSGGNGVAGDVISGTTTNSGQWQLPDEFSLFFGGRIAENIGFLNEISLAGVTTTAGAVAAQLRVPIVFDVGGTNLSVIPFISDTGSVAYGYELASTGMVRALRWSEERAAISAMNFIGINSGPATGLAFVAQNDMGYINLTRWAPVFTANGTAARQLRSNWLRVAATPTVADWAMHIGLGISSGTNWRGATPAGVTVTTLGAVTAVPSTSGVQVDTKATVLDFQGQTQLAGKDFSLYASYAKAPGQAAATVIKNMWNANVNSKTAWAIGADYSVIPNVLHLGGSILRGDNGTALGFNKDNAWMVQGIYDLAQNVALHAVYKRNSGSRYVTGIATDMTTLMLEAAW